ncbi:hypothetical protein [Micromonospora siamensis]|uniref:Uncharacterized protein n=1 Tax=Micromonospora siamensis TaxID=299152 RepID=A0A1C5IXU6_9ACTN|nr:hypothetical protein [Micromonospora siamensis]SCG63162.1 hypothetical protein GA0074704_3920 [Micromonospora siamensis]
MDPITAAARDNADWCAAVCAAHGLTGVVDTDAWSVPRRSPPLYPDAVTLRPGVDPGALLARIDAGPGASVKDSFADLDLHRHGFRVLFAAEWIHRPPVDPPAAPALTPVTTAAALARWAAAHGGGPAFRPALLAAPRITVLARYAPDGTVTGGAVLTRGPVVTGVSNVFGEGVWPAVCGSASSGVALVGYESGDDLAAAARVGFTAVGPLRIWLRD